MKKAGLIGGIGPASTLEYYNDIIRYYREIKQDGQYPALVIDNINMTQMLEYIEKHDFDSLLELLLSAVENVKNAGAEFAAIASNTPHIVFEELQARSPIPLISIVEATCSYAKEKGCRRLVILGTKFTMSNGFYTDKLASCGIEAFVPEEEEKDAVQNIIFPKLEEGIVDPEDKERLLGIAEKLLKEKQGDGLVLGCTELPLMVREGDIDTQLLNTTQIHIKAIVDYMLED